MIHCDCNVCMMEWVQRDVNGTEVWRCGMVTAKQWMALRISDRERHYSRAHRGKEKRVGKTLQWNTGRVPSLFLQCVGPISDQCDGPAGLAFVIGNHEALAVRGHVE